VGLSTSAETTVPFRINIENVLGMRLVLLLLFSPASSRELYGVHHKVRFCDCVLPTCNHALTVDSTRFQAIRSDSMQFC